MEQKEQKKKKTLFWVLAGIIVVLALIFTFQNTTPTEINFLFVELKGPLFLVIIIVFLLGFILGRIFPFLRKKKKAE